MKGFCGIDICDDRAFISFASSEKGRINFLEEIDINIPLGEKSYSEYLLQNSEIINQRIKEKEKELSLTVGKIFLNLLPQYAKYSIVEDTVSLKRLKKVANSDIVFIKKYIEDIFLDWDDICLHNFVLNYEAEGNSYKEPPLRIFAKKIKIKSQLFWTKDKLYKDTRDIFSNLEREFGGFVHHYVSVLSESLEEEDKKKIFIVVNIGHKNSEVVVYHEGIIYSFKEFDFSLRRILEEIKNKFLFPYSVAQEVFNRYVSFREFSHLKEVSVKNGDSYVNISTQALNSFVKTYIKNEINIILAEITDKLGQDFKVSFIGRLNSKDEFHSFLKEFAPYIKPPLCENSSSSFGCLRYGTSRFLGQRLENNESFFRRLLNIYKDYF